MNAPAPWTIIGQGLAGTCLAWELHRRGAPSVILDRETGGSSRVAAGLINPVTGKNFEPTAGVADLLPEALAFYQHIATILGQSFWHPLPILRLAADETEWRKMTTKAGRPEVARWLTHDGRPVKAPGWAGALEITGGGRLDTRAFLDASREFFRKSGAYRRADHTDPPPDSPTPLVFCDGAAGLMTGRHGPHRCAKGEILTLSAPDWDASRIRIGAGGWLVPLGGGHFKAGATYQWQPLDETPTADGLRRIRSIAARLAGNDSFEVVAHQAGIRPILRRSRPLIGPLGNGRWMCNGLGSKGSLVAPACARRLADWLVHGREPNAEWDLRHWNPNPPQ